MEDNHTEVTPKSAPQKDDTLIESDGQSALACFLPFVARNQTRSRPQSASTSQTHTRTRAQSSSVDDLPSSQANANTTHTVTDTTTGDTQQYHSVDDTKIEQNTVHRKQQRRPSPLASHVSILVYILCVCGCVGYHPDSRFQVLTLVCILTLTCLLHRDLS
jgi:cobalamin biosynthesis Mg chelatase CobN